MGLRIVHILAVVDPDRNTVPVVHTLEVVHKVGTAVGEALVVA